MFDKLDLPSEYAALNDGTGKCKYLKDNLCSIYDERPFLCNSTLVYNELYKDKMSFDEFEQMVKKECDIIISKYGGKNFE